MIHDRKQFLRNSAAIVCGNALYSLSVAAFLEPAGLITGGATGIALAVGRLTGLSVSGFLLFFNLAMLAWGWLVLGRAFAFNTLASSILSPIFLALWERLLAGRGLTDDIVLCTIFSGLGIGAALAIVIRAGASTGGMDIPPLILRKKFHIPVSFSLWTFDFTIMLCQMTFHPLEDLLYGILLIIVLSVSLNKVMLLGTSKTEVKIVSSRAQEIRDGILTQVDRGVTMLQGRGGYRHDETEVILSVVSNHELPKIESLARDIDPNCFMIISRVTEVWGRGFSYSKQSQTEPQT